MGNLLNPTSNHGEKKHYTNKDLFWSSCTYDWFCNINIQLRSGWTIFLPFNRLDNRNENSEPPGHGMDFCQKQVSGILFDLPRFELKEPPNTVCYGSLHQNKSYLFILQILTIRTPHAMHIEAKSARCWKDFPEDPHPHFPPGSTFHPNRNAVAKGLSFVNVLCTQSESKLPMIMERNKNHQITSPRGQIGFSSWDVSDKYEPKYQIRDPYELTNAIPSTNEYYNGFFLLHSTPRSQLPDKFLQIVFGNKKSILEQPTSIRHCISVDA